MTLYNVNLIRKGYRMSQTQLPSLVVVSLIFGLTVSANADLFDRGGGLIYDSDLDITWLQNANYAGGPLSLGQAQQWVEDLEYQGYNDWRLPSALNQDGSGPDSTSPSGGGPYIVDDSEMGHLYFVELGNALNGPLTNIGPFQNVLDDTEGNELLSGHYWYAESGDPPYGSLQWMFSFNDGYQTLSGLWGSPAYAWAVRDGDSVPVPVPGALILAGIGIGFASWLDNRNSRDLKK